MRLSIFRRLTAVLLGLALVLGTMASGPAGRMDAHAADGAAGMGAHAAPAQSAGIVSSHAVSVLDDCQGCGDDAKMAPGACASLCAAPQAVLASPSRNITAAAVTFDLAPTLARLGFTPPPPSFPPKPAFLI